MQPLILITNDDGIYSPGLIAAAEAVEPFGELLIVAPRFQQTNMSRSYPKTDDQGIIDIVELNINGRSHVAYGVHGSPALAVSHGILEIANKKPHLCVSGINYGENLGLEILASGTIGAALEGDTYDIPSIAVSLETNLDLRHTSDYDELDWHTAKHFTAVFAEKVLKFNLPYNIGVLNINIPTDATTATKIRKTVQSRQNYCIFVKPETRNFAEKFRFKVAIEVDQATLEPDSDIQAIFYDRVVSVTPLRWNLTADTTWGDEYRY